VFHHFRRDQRLAILAAIEDRNWHAPDPLARDAPGGPALHHAADALLAPGRDDAAVRGDLVDGGQRGLADGGAAASGQIDLEIQADPPLVGRAEDDRVL